MQKQINISNLRKQFGQFTAVNNLNFTAKQGEVLGLLGPNGAGKTTSMRMIAGYLTPSEGSITICGHNIVTQQTAAQSKIGYVPEGAPLYPDMTPKMFLRFMGEARGMRGNSLSQRLNYVANKLHLHSMWEQTLDTLSKGYKRRVALAQAILHDPDVLILDEPTDGLDPIQKREIRSLITEMSHDKIIIISTHILEEVEAVCTRAMIISDGTMLADDIPTNFLQQDSLHHSISIELDSSILDTTSGTALIQQLENLVDVDRVEHLQHAEATKKHSNQYKLLIFPKGKEKIFDQVNNCLQQNNITALSISENVGKLENVFCTLINQQQLN